jgi:hypothetical protein
MAETPTKQKIKIPPYSTASIKVAAIMAFLLSVNIYNPYSPQVMS